MYKLPIYLKLINKLYFTLRHATVALVHYIVLCTPVNL